MPADHMRPATTLKSCWRQTLLSPAENLVTSGVQSTFQRQIKQVSVTYDP
jgi:hypothetical protein